MQKFQLNSVKERILVLSPLVQGRLESELKTDDFEVLDRLGKGAFGKVYKTRMKKTGQIMALKQMEKQQIRSQGMAKQIQLEVKVMYNLDHTNIVKLYDHFEEENFIYLQLEYAGGGQLWQKLTKAGRFDENTVKKYMADIILAVEYLHSQNPPIIHRDIKPENLILDDSGRVKLVDFGWSNFNNRQRMTYCGTLEYLAPEMILEQGHDEKLDIWSLGVLIYELITGKAPFAPNPNSPDKPTDPTQTRALLEDNILKVRLEYPSDFPQLAKDLVASLLKREPNQRKSLTEAKKHPWFILDSEGKNIFDMYPWNQNAQQTVQQDYILLPSHINSLRLEGGFTNQFIADFANRLHPSLVKSILQQIQLAQSSSSTQSITQNSLANQNKQNQNQSSNQADYVAEMEIMRKKLEQQNIIIQDLNKQKGDIQVQFKVKEEENKQLKENLESVKSSGTSSSVGDQIGAEQRRLQVCKEEIERLLSEKEELQDRQCEYEREIKQINIELKKSQETKKDLERYKQERTQLVERVKRLQEESMNSTSESVEKLQKSEQEFSVLQIKLSQYERAKGAAGGDGGVVDLVRELNTVVEELKKRFVLTKKQIEINEKYTSMERDLLRMKCEKDTLEADIRSNIQEEYEDKIEAIEIQNKQKIQQLNDEHDNVIAQLTKQLEIFKEEQSKISQKDLEYDSLKKQLELAQNTINDLRVEHEQNKKVKQFLEKRLKDVEDEVSDLQQMVKSLKAAQKK